MFRDRISKGKLSVLRIAAIALAIATGYTTVGLAATRPSLQHPTLKAPHLLHNSPDNSVPSVSFLQSSLENSEVTYNLQTPPNLKESEQLQAIVNEVVEMADDKRLPKNPLSITLINVKTGEIAGYSESKERYPASVVKMFWMAAVYAEIEAGILNEGALNRYIAKMIKNSDNDAAAVILDKITNTRSSRARLSKKEFVTWLNKRQFVNRFFRAAGYWTLNINQKTFPVYDINMPAPRGTDLQMRGNPNAPIRNKITTEHAARLLYEICVSGQAVSPSASQKMSAWLKRDLNSEVWKKQDGFNPIRGLLGEGLADTDVEFYSKAGWTPGTRNDVAFVRSPDGETAYILAVFGDSSAYARDGKIFPKMSRLVFDRMSRL